MDPPAATAPHWLVVVPGGHCGGGATNWQNMSWGPDVFSEQMRTLFTLRLTEPDSILAATLQRQLDAAPRLTFYLPGPGLPGSLGNYWVQADAFPTPTVQTLYAVEGGALQYARPEPAAGAVANFTYDPADPVPTWVRLLCSALCRSVSTRPDSAVTRQGGNNLMATTTHLCGPQDQRVVEDGRNDLLQFVTPTLGAPLAIVGNVTVSLAVGSDRPDTDFVAKLVDVWPNGTRMLVQDGIIRMRWRDGPLAPAPAAPLVPSEVRRND